MIDTSHSKSESERKKMQPDSLKNASAKAPWLVTHPLSQEDSVAAAALRSALAPIKGKFEGTSGRAAYDSIMERVPAPAGVTFQADTVGGISGWWAMPALASKSAAMIMRMVVGSTRALPRRTETSLATLLPARRPIPLYPIIGSLPSIPSPPPLRTSKHAIEGYLTGGSPGSH